MFFAKIILHDNTSRVQSLYQNINLGVYQVLSLTTNQNNQTHLFEQIMLAHLQTDTNSPFYKCFKDHIPDLYEERHSNRCGRCILVNVLKYFLIDD